MLPQPGCAEGVLGEAVSRTWGASCLQQSCYFGTSKEFAAPRARKDAVVGEVEVGESPAISTGRRKMLQTLPCWKVGI